LATAWQCCSFSNSMVMQQLQKQHGGAAALEMPVTFSKMVVMVVTKVVVMLSNYLAMRGI